MRNYAPIIRQPREVRLFVFAGGEFSSLWIAEVLTSVKISQSIVVPKESEKYSRLSWRFITLQKWDEPRYVTYYVILYQF